jgi:hypothetical protein
MTGLAWSLTQDVLRRMNVSRVGPWSELCGADRLCSADTIPRISISDENIRKAPLGCSDSASALPPNPLFGI